MPEFYVTFARKISKIPEFYMIFARKCPNFYMIIAQKNIFPDLFCPLPPVSNVYESSHQTMQVIKAPRKELDTTTIRRVAR